MISRVDLEQIACALEFEGRPSAADQVRDTATQLEAMQAEIERFQGLARFLYGRMTPGQLLEANRYMGDDEILALSEARASLDRQGK